MIWQENVAEAADAPPTPQVEVTETQEASNDSENPPSGDAIAEESPSQPFDEPSQGGEGAEAPTGDAAGDEANQLQEGGDGEEKVDSVDDTGQPQERQEHVELEVSSFCDSHVTQWCQIKYLMVWKSRQSYLKSHSLVMFILE